MKRKVVRLQTVRYNQLLKSTHFLRVILSFIIEDKQNCHAADMRDCLSPFESTRTSIFAPEKDVSMMISDSFILKPCAFVVNNVKHPKKPCAFVVKNVATSKADVALHKPNQTK